MKRIAWIAVSAVFVMAPAWAGSFDKNDTLKPDEGIALVSLSCGSPVMGVQVFAEGTSSAGFFGSLKSDGGVACRDVWTLRLKAGRYYVGRLYSMSDELAIEPDKAPTFNIEAGKLNYIGDLYAGNLPGAVDTETLMRVAGRMLTVLNHEPQMRERIREPKHAWMARYEFVTDKALGPPAPVAEIPSLPGGSSQTVMQISKARWKRGEDGQPLVCPRLVPLPKGEKATPDTPRTCDGEFVTPTQLVASEFGTEFVESGTVVQAQARDGEDGPLTVISTGPIARPKPKPSERRQLDVPAGRWSNGRLGTRICYDPSLDDTRNLDGESGRCTAQLVSAGAYLRNKVGKHARLVGTTPAQPDGSPLRIDYDVDLPVQ